MLNTHRNRHSTPSLLRGAAAALFVAATVAIATAQAPFATVSGAVVDPTGGVIPGVTLMLSHAQSGVQHQIKTDTTGRFEFVGLSAGDYVLESSTVGFATGRDTLALSPGQLLSRSVVLQVGTLNETITVTDSDAPARVAGRRAEPREPKPCAPAAVGGRIVPPLKLVDVKPIYPLNLRPSKASGVVEMDATIGPDGSVTAVNVVSSPEPDMSAAAVAAVREWKFSPTLLNCAPIDVNMHVRASFQGQP